MTNHNAPAPARHNTALTPFGGRDEVRELKARLEFMALTLPGGRRMTTQEITALAQASIAHGLSPFTGEIWLIPGSGLMIGIKGLRKKAREQDAFSVEFRQIVSPEEKAALGIPANALAFECRLSVAGQILSYAAEFIKLMKAGVSEATAFRILGERPYTSGYGYYVPGERTKMTPVQVAYKRAEADAIKRAFDVPLGLNATDDANPTEFSGDWIEGTATPASDLEPQAGGEPDGFDVPGNRPEESDGVRVVVDETKPLHAGQTFSKPDSPQPPGWLDDAGKVIPADYLPSTPIWLKWAELKQQAIALHVAAPVMDAAATDKEVASACNKLAAELKAARKKGAASLYPKD